MITILNNAVIEKYNSYILDVLNKVSYSVDLM